MLPESALLATRLAVWEQQQQACASESFSLAEGLLGHEEQQQQDTDSWCVQAVLAAASYNACSQRSQQQQHLPIKAQAVLKWICKIAVNGITLRPVLDSGDGFGNALFPFAAYFNHSCAPNTTLR